MLKALLLSVVIGLTPPQANPPRTYVEACLQAIENDRQLRVFVGVPAESGNWVSWSAPAGWGGMQRGVIIGIPLDDWVYEIERIERPLLPSLVPAGQLFWRVEFVNQFTGTVCVGSS